MQSVISNSLPIMAKPTFVPTRQNVNRFSFDVPADQPTYASPATTPDSSAQYGSLTPSPPTNQFSFMPRGLPPFSAPRGSLSFSGQGARYDTPTAAAAAGPYPPPGEGDPYYYPSFATPPRPNKKKSPTAKKADGKQPTFLTKLYAILETPEYHHIIRWDEDGTVIIIEKPDELADKILPLVYRQSRFASFSRQLNIYGWMRKVSLRHVEKGIVDPDASTWSHNFLRRDSSRDELINFKRRVPPRPSQATRGRSDLPTPAEIEYGSDPYSSPDGYHQHLFDEQQGYVHAHAHTYTHGYSHSFGSGAYQQTLPPPPCLLASPLPMMDRMRPAPIAISSFSQVGMSDQLPQHQPQPSSQGQSLPQTAPLSNTLFTTPVTKGHNRTRSYQCNSPLNPNVNLNPTIMGNTNPDPSHAHSHSKSLSTSWKPLYNPLDPSSWAKRGFTDFQGNPMQVSSSVPANFGSSTPQSTPPMSGQAQDHQDQNRDQTYVAAPAQWTPSPPQQSFSSAISVDSSPTTPVLEGTISPAVFRPGYTPPAGVPMPMPQSSTPFSKLSGGGMGHQRRPSHPHPHSHPYSQDGTRPSMAGHNRTLSLGEQVGIKFPTIASRRPASGMEGLEASSGLGMGEEPVEKKTRVEEDTLPSAALKGFQRMPFEGILPEQDEPMN